MSDVAQMSNISQRIRSIQNIPYSMFNFFLVTKRFLPFFFLKTLSHGPQNWQLEEFRLTSSPVSRSPVLQAAFYIVDLKALQFKVPISNCLFLRTMWHGRDLFCFVLFVYFTPCL